ncbi:aldehyde dehydrogenase, dimeric NADP-preferring [Galendromus occidentalis]|uniref:Aldehyde dehydrogenase n=1 Tax=Galendromus occidentalis TaxID=34638 RepID=A0AAJ6VZD0_9ACAR|nr:aldehyde dehydrogenase, dimeric NADP-preferring [Galendromus occidentalis]
MAEAAKPFHILDGGEKVETKYTGQIDKLRATFASGRTRNIKWRVEQLKQLERFFSENRDAMIEALDKDLSKNKMESVLFELEVTLNEVKGALSDIHDWVKPEPVGKNPMTVLDKPYIHSEPLGVCLIMGAWNYPVNLAIAPAIGAIAAGNAVVLKPSDLSPATALLMEKLTDYLDPDAFLVVNGGIPETTELLKEKFDHIFYTGSVNVGKIVHAAAQKHLTPVVLELGGKSPVFIDASADLEISVRRILWGKWINAGQTCVAPDYILCTEAIYDRIIDICKTVAVEFFGDNPKESKDFGRIVTPRHAKRLESLLQDVDAAVGGDSDTNNRYVAPTVLRNVKKTDPIMREEIFGPILPVLKTADLTEAIEYINSRDKPLTAYVFAKDSRVIKRFIQETTSGSVCVNDVVVQLSLDTLPFGGVGNSGIGKYHGKHSFDCYSNKKAVLQRDFNPIGEMLGKKRYPPYTDGKLKLFQQLLLKRSNPLAFACKAVPYAIGAALGAGGVFLYQYLTTVTEQKQ